MNPERLQLIKLVAIRALTSCFFRKSLITTRRKYSDIRWMSPTESPPQSPRLGHTLTAAYYQDTVVPLQSTRASVAAEALILAVLFPALGEREVRTGSSRPDFRFRLPGDPRGMVLEVKCCTLVEEGTAMFPDAMTGRGLRHPNELAA